MVWYMLAANFTMLYCLGVVAAVYYSRGNSKLRKEEGRRDRRSWAPTKKGERESGEKKSLGCRGGGGERGA